MFLGVHPVAKYPLMHHLDQVIISMKGQALHNMNKVTEEGNSLTHMQEMATMTQEARFHLHMDTSRTTCLHHCLLFHQRILDCMGNTHSHMLGFMVEATSPLHMVETNSGSNNHIVHMLEEGPMEVGRHRQGLIHDYNNHIIVMVLWTEVQTGGLHLDMADNRLYFILSFPSKIRLHIQGIGCIQDLECLVIFKQLVMTSRIDRDYLYTSVMFTPSGICGGRDIKGFEARFAH